ncbi:MAG: ROK family protein, partial [Caulobacteraceae bacterium]|nr:ROK family protein [Caulobacter sp.]
LAAEGLVLDAGQRRGGRGQPATRLAVDPDGRLSLGVNVDRDHITAVLLDLAGAVRARRTREGPLADPQTTAATVRRMARELVDDVAAARRRPLLGVGLAIPDDLDSVDLPTLHPREGWGAVDIVSLFTSALGLPVQVENDAAAAAIGELHFGRGLGAPSFFYVLITAGLGGGLVVDGEYFRGANGRSGEIGFLPLHGADGEARTLQEEVSLSALVAHLAVHGLAVDRPSSLADLPPRAARLVDAWLDRAADLLTEPLKAIGWLIDPAAVLLGGRLPPAMLDDLAGRLALRLEGRGPPACARTPVLRAAAAEDAPAVGAAILPFLLHVLPSRSTLLKVAEG